MKRLMILAFCILLASPLAAAPSIFGPTGLIAIPTGEALNYREVSIAYDYIFAESVDDDQWRYKANLGTFQNWELGVVGGDVPDEGMFLNVKYFLLSDNTRFPLSIAIGGQNLGSEDLTDVYMVASKRFEGGFSLHLGFKAQFADQIDPYIMAGADYFVTNELSIMADISGQQEEYFYNVGAQYYVTPEISFRGMIIDLGQSLFDETRYSLGIAFSKFI